MVNAFVCITILVFSYIVMKWPIPSLVVLGTLFTVNCLRRDKGGIGTEANRAAACPVKPQTAPIAQKAQPQSTTKRKESAMPNTKELLYPAEVPTFAELAAGGHRDPRALIYTISALDPKRKRPFSDEEISYYDFGKKSAVYSALRKAELIKPLEPGAELEEIYTRDELSALVHERGLSDKGRKRALADRLVDSGYKIDRRKFRKHLFRLTETGAGIVTICQNNRQAAIANAITALKETDYQGAVTAYRKYDSKWGFAHASGKVHTIFAYYDIPYSRFWSIENCAMSELNNTESFKKTLRACLLAGLMRGCQDSWTLTCDFKSVCKEEIDCPQLLSLFDYELPVLQNMQRQIECSPDNALEYYISHLLYLSRR